MEKSRVPDLYFMILSVRPKASMNPYSEDGYCPKPLHLDTTKNIRVNKIYDHQKRNLLVQKDILT